jgi:hypothetical protein
MTEGLRTIPRLRILFLLQQPELKGIEPWQSIEKRLDEGAAQLSQKAFIPARI